MRLFGYEIRKVPPPPVPWQQQYRIQRAKKAQERLAAQSDWDRFFREFEANQWKDIGELLGK